MGGEVEAVTAVMIAVAADGWGAVDGPPGTELVEMGGSGSERSIALLEVCLLPKIVLRQSLPEVVVEKFHRKNLDEALLVEEVDGC